MNYRNLLFAISAFFLMSSFSAIKLEVKTFRIIAATSSINTKKYVDAINGADMEPYRFRTKRNTLSFDDGVKVEFFSAEEIKASGGTIDLYNYSDDRTKNYVEPILHIAESGSIVAMYPIASPK